MPKYKLRMPPEGDYLYSDDGTWYIGKTAEAAHDFFADEWDPTEWVYPVIIRGHILYKRDIDAGDGHEDAEPGDTTFWIVTQDTEKALAHECLPSEVMAWVRGTPRPWWTYGPNGYGENLTYHAKVGEDELGNFETREAAEEAVKKLVKERVQEWKDAHPECYRPLPEEPDDDA